MLINIYFQFEWKQDVRLERNLGRKKEFGTLVKEDKLTIISWNYHCVCVFSQSWTRFANNMAVSPSSESLYSGQSYMQLEFCLMWIKHGVQSSSHVHSLNVQLPEVILESFH